MNSRKVGGMKEMHDGATYTWAGTQAEGTAMQEASFTRSPVFSIQVERI